jgi:hypothetical protein
LTNAAIIPDETFSHLFYDCETTRIWHANFLREHTPENFFNNVEEKRLYLITGFCNRYPKNLFLTMSALLFHYCIWEARLKKKIPSFQMLNEDFLEMMINFIWSNSVAYSTIVAHLVISHCPGTWAMEESPQQDKDKMGSLLNNRVTRAMLADNNGTTTPSGNISAMLPDPPLPQMNNSLKIVHELDPDGILDKNANEESSFKMDGEATDQCHTLSSSDNSDILFGNSGLGKSWIRIRNRTGSGDNVNFPGHEARIRSGANSNSRHTNSGSHQN